ncbi:MAG: delta-60 repeat domain-containing protein [Opitutaceae bacterium]|nr:delta-60 repeat domain-containing protein [Opitutaceae bacterium]
MRLAANGRNDDTFRAPTWTTSGVRLGQITAAPDGSVLALFFGQRGRRGVIRFDPSGAYDPDFAAELGDATSQITDLYPLPDGQLLAFGSFTSIGGVAQPYLARLTPNTRAGATHLGNLSVRSVAGTGAATLAAGYISSGGNTTVLARAAGPALAQFGVANPLADPRLALFQGAAVVATNDNWSAEPDNLIASTASRLSAFPFPIGSRDAALIATTPAGARTVQVTGGELLPGVALLELYHAGTAPVSARSPRFTNFSARSSTGNGSETLIAGFTLNGDSSRNVLIRAAGPALTKFGVSGALADPVLTLFRGSTVVARNDQWEDGTAEDVFLRREAVAATGAFPFDAAAKDSALVVTLPPGQYTAHVTGTGNSTGIALVEFYEVP